VSGQTETRNTKVNPNTINTLEDDAYVLTDRQADRKTYLPHSALFMHKHVYPLKSMEKNRGNP
jgi:hypothetical protein